MDQGLTHLIILAVGACQAPNVTSETISGLTSLKCMNLIAM
jgi:hypothetical protein